MIRYNIILFFVSYLFSFTYSQETIDVISKGISITRDITPEEAKFKAIEEAKINALRKAGISESISSTDFLHTYQEGDQLTQYFDEISTSEITGSIIVNSILDEDRKFDDNNNMIIEVEISATIFKYSTKSDPAFFFNLSGLKDTYYDNENISFSFKPSHDGYLKIFVINENETILLYPFQHENQNYLSDKPDSLFRKGITISFPIHQAYKPGYTISIKEGKRTEYSKLIFVYLMRDIQCLDSHLDIKKIFNWIYSIPLNQRYVEYRTLLLKKS